MLLGLQLNTLTAEDPYHDKGHLGGFSDTGVNYNLSDLIGSDEWKELRYSNRTTEFLEWNSYTTQYRENKRELQPGGWTKTLEAKDGLGKGIGVWMFRALEEGIEGAAEDDSRSEKWDQELASVVPKSMGERAPQRKKSNPGELHTKVLLGC